MPNSNDQNYLAELSRHYDSTLWTVTSIWTASVGGLLIYSRENFDPWLAIFGLALTVCAMFFAYRFRTLRRHLHAHMRENLHRLHMGGPGFRQWDAFSLMFFGLVFLWARLLIQKSSRLWPLWLLLALLAGGCVAVMWRRERRQDSMPNKEQEMPNTDKTNQAGETNTAPQPTKESDESIATLFSAFQALSMHGQENKNFALYNFLLINSFLLVSWATLFSQERMKADVISSTLLCIVGILVAIVWRGLLKDYSNSSDLFRRYIVKFEGYLPTRWQGAHAGREEQIDKRNKASSQQGLGKGVGSRDLLAFIPYAFVLIYGVLILMTWLKFIEYVWLNP